jgi:hypothetical protein
MQPSVQLRRYAGQFAAFGRAKKISFLDHNRYFYEQNYSATPKLKTPHMRKVCLLFVLSTICSLSLFAQAKSRTGFKIGANYMTQRVEIDRDYSYNDFIYGFTIGLFREVPLNNFMAFQTELSYNRMGSERDNEKTKLDYISLPVMLKIHGKRFGWYAGPQLSLLLKAKQENRFLGNTDVKDTYKSVDLGAITGVEYSFGPNNRFVISGRWQFSMNDVWKDADGGESLRNTGAQLTAGVRF